MSNTASVPFDNTDAFAASMAAQGWKLQADGLSKEEAEDAANTVRAKKLEARRTHSGATWRVWRRAANWDHPLSVITAAGS